MVSIAAGGIRSRIGLSMLANFMKSGVIFEYVLKRGLLEFAIGLPTGSPEFRYCYHETSKRRSTR